MLCLSTFAVDSIRIPHPGARHVGSSGIFFYSIYDLYKDPHFTQLQGWQRMSRVALEIQRFAAILLGPRAGGAAVLTPARPFPGWLMLRSHWGVGKNSSDFFIFAVNDGTGSGQVTLVASDGRKLEAVTVVNEQPERVVTARPSPSSFRFAMASLDVTVLRVRFSQGSP